MSAILEADPEVRPETVKRSPAPVCHASKGRYTLYLKVLEAVFQAFDIASKAFRSGDFTVAFPEGTFRPLGGFVGWVESPAPI